MGALPGSPLVQWSVKAVPYREINGSPGGPGAPTYNNNNNINGRRNIRLGKPLVKCNLIQNKSSDNWTFSWPCGDVGLHLWPIGQSFGTDAEVVCHPISQVFNFHPQGRVAFYIHCNNFTDTWSVRRGICKGDTTNLDTCKSERSSTYMHVI